MSSTVECEFAFPFSLGGRQFILRAPLKLPLDHPVPELAHRLILAHNLLCTVEEGKHFDGSVAFHYVVFGFDPSALFISLLSNAVCKSGVSTC